MRRGLQDEVSLVEHTPKDAARCSREHGSKSAHSRAVVKNKTTVGCPRFIC